MDCDFCLDMEADEMLEDYDVSVRTSPASFNCCECRREFPPGVEQEIATGNLNGEEPYESLTCIDCHHIAEGLVCGSRVHGNLYEEIEAMLDNGAKITTACLGKIETASAKAYLVARINQLNGLSND